MGGGRVCARRSSSHTCRSESLVSVARLLIQVKRPVKGRGTFLTTLSRHFRWAAAITVLSGLILSWLNGYAHQAMTLGIGSGYGKSTAIGIGMWLGIIMAYNVWFVIWPILVTI